MSEINNALTGNNGKGTNKGEAMQDKDIKMIPTIPDGASLNDPAGCIPDAVFTSLPDILRDACQTLTDQTEREVFLIGALGVVSGMLPNVRGFYNGGLVGPELFVYILAPYGAGKGALKYAYQLGRPLHGHKREISQNEIAAHRQALSELKKGEPEPEHPGNKMLFLPANNSKSGLLQLLSENRSRGILFETEGDTLADALKQEQGNFSDLLRKAFHHEPVTYYRKTGREIGDIEKPALAVVLSSTPDQYTKLIPTAANGLFSRFLHFRLKPAPDFADVFDKNKRNYLTHFDSAGERLKNLYLQLEALEDGRGIEFDLQENQKGEFLAVFAEIKTEFHENVTPEMQGTANRLALICFRLCMVFTALRTFLEHDDFPPLMTCEDRDFKNVLRLMDILKSHALDMFYRLPKPAITAEAAEMEKELLSKADKVAQCRQLFAQGHKPLKIADKIGEPKTTVYRWINEFKK